MKQVVDMDDLDQLTHTYTKAELRPINAPKKMAARKDMATLARNPRTIFDRVFGRRKAGQSGG